MLSLAVAWSSVSHWYRHKLRSTHQAQSRARRRVQAEDGHSGKGETKTQETFLQEQFNQHNLLHKTDELKDGRGVLELQANHQSVIDTLFMPLPTSLYTELCIFSGINRRT
jgi:hypothetical protein